MSFEKWKYEKKREKNIIQKNEKTWNKTYLISSDLTTDHNLESIASLSVKRQTE